MLIAVYNLQTNHFNRKKFRWDNAIRKTFLILLPMKRVNKIAILVLIERTLLKRKLNYAEEH